MPVENLTLAAMREDMIAQGPIKTPDIALIVCCSGNTLVGPTGMEIHPNVAPNAPNIAI